MPDVLVDFNGLRTVIEGEIDTSPEAAERALASARRRVEEGIAHIAIGVLYPESLQAVGFRALKDELGACRLRMAIVTEATPTTPEFVAGTVDDLETALRLAFDQLIKEDVVATAVAALDAGIERFATVIITKMGIVERVAEVLGMVDWSKDLNSEGGAE